MEILEKRIVQKFNKDETRWSGAFHGLETMKEQGFLNVGATHASPLLTHQTGTIRACK
jgi:hypothetical protein